MAAAESRRKSPLSVVFCMDGAREWYRDVIVCENEMYCSPRVAQESAHARFRPHGDYDIAAYLRTLPPPWNDPSLLVVHDDADGNSRARNLAAVKCPKVFMVGDTHHYSSPAKVPIARPVEYAVAEGFDLVVAEFTRHHLHFFHEAGAKCVRWLPDFIISPFERPPTGAEGRTRGVTFVGGTQRHPYRKHLLDTLVRAGIGVEVASTNRRDTALVHSQSRINLNISLNGDLNLRTLEVMASGGFLVTERLPPESGLGLLFEDGKHLVMYDDVNQLAELIRHYLAHPGEAEQIAAEGFAEYQRRHRPAVKARELLEMVEGVERRGGGTAGPELYDIKLDRRTELPPERGEALRRRIAFYETLQELHRVNMRLDVLFWPGAERHAIDAIDLYRLRATMVKGDAGQEETGEQAIEACGLGGRIKWIQRESPELEQGQWSIWVCPVGLLRRGADAVLRRGLAGRRCTALFVPDVDPQRDAAVVQEIESECRMVRFSEQPCGLKFLP